MEADLTATVTRLVLGLAAILFVAKLGGEVAERLFHLPSILGELAGGVLIGPYALGGLPLPLLGPLFPLPSAGGGGSLVPVSSELWSFAQVAAIVLLFVAGLETDLRQFLRFAPQAGLVALGGVVLPFVLGDYATVLLGFAAGPLDPKALFMGAAMTATSVGITAGVLKAIERINTPEGVTILGAAVIDDVLGILVVTIVAGISLTGEVSAGTVALVGSKALGIWIGLTALGILAARPLSRFLLGFRSAGAALGLTLALAFLAAAVAESAGLAMIIGAYSMGLALSNTELKRRVEEPIEAIVHGLVPIFFVVMGMVVNLPAVEGALGFGVAITALAIVGKVLGCSVPALATGFSWAGAWRIGVGMLPRGEVALIVAGVGLSRGIVGTELFGVVILMTVVTTFLAPALLVPAFRRGGSGLRRERTPL